PRGSDPADDLAARRKVPRPRPRRDPPRRLRRSGDLRRREHSRPGNVRRRQPLPDGHRLRVRQRATHRGQGCRAGYAGGEGATTSQLSTCALTGVYKFHFIYTSLLKSLLPALASTQTLLAEEN